MLSRKHYKAIAEIIRTKYVDLAETVAGYIVKAILEIIAQDLANYFEADDPQFATAEFLAACGISG